MKFEDIKLWQFIYCKDYGWFFLPTKIEDTVVRGLIWDERHYYETRTSWISSKIGKGSSHDAANYELLSSIERLLPDRRDMILSVFSL